MVRAVLVLQLLMIVGDLACNVAAPLLYKYNTVQLMLYIFQDVSTVMALIVILLSFFSTFVFQAGLINILVARFQVTIYVSFLYLALSVTLHIWSLSELWENETSDIWSPGLVFLYATQRTCSAVYYFFYKRTALMLGDPHFYEDTPWLRQQLSRPNK